MNIYKIINIYRDLKFLWCNKGILVTDLIYQVSQLLRAELEELVDVARATMEPIEPCDEEW